MAVSVTEAAALVGHCLVRRGRGFRKVLHEAAGGLMAEEHRPDDDGRIHRRIPFPAVVSER